MKLIFTTTLLLFVIALSGQYNYGLEVEEQDAKIEGKLNLDSDNKNVFIGADAGISNTSGSENTTLGSSVGLNNTTGQANIFIGSSAGLNNTTGSYNSFIGRFAGIDNTSGNENTLLGSAAGFQNTTGIMNTILGSGAGLNNKTGSYNCFIGRAAGLFNKTGVMNTTLGRSAGYYNTGSFNLIIGHGAGPTASNTDQDYKLYIDVVNVIDGISGNDNPLIYGEFDNDLVRINGTLHISETAKLEPQAAEPSTCMTAAEYGLMYYDNSSTTHKLKVCTNAGWEVLN